MLNELDELIKFIYTKYIEFNEKWQRSEYYSRINLNNNNVCDLLENELILSTIFNYRKFINDNNVQLVMDFRNFNNEKSKVNTRVKTKNSIEYKIRNYIQNHEYGKIPINKCLNDLFGIRMISTKPIFYEQINRLVKEKYKNLKCIDSSKQEYKATHIYFKSDNFNLQWELQIWNKEDEISNVVSHKKYKQDYVKWEKENRGSE